MIDMAGEIVASIRYQVSGIEIWALGLKGEEFDFGGHFRLLFFTL